MSAAQLEAVIDPPRSADRLVARLDELMAELAGEVADCTPVPDAARIDRIGRLEQLRAVTAALQAAETVRFARSHAEAQSRDGVHPTQIGLGIADQVGLAGKQSPFQGARRLAVARALWSDLPQCFAAMTAGQLSERVVELVVDETRHLGPELREQVDGQVIAARITEMGVRAAGQCARKYAYEADRAGYVARGKLARTQRRVTLRPGSDTMAYLTGALPLEQGVACWAALRQAADSGQAHGDQRSRGQIMADTMVQRLTGQTAAADIDVEVQIMLPGELVANPDSHRTATVQGHGPLPGELATDIIDRSNGRKRWRRASTGGPFGHHRSPTDAPSAPSTRSTEGVTDLDQRRRFTGALADLIKLRDQTCRAPYCDAPIRHLDHILEHRHGGRTVLANGQGLCAHHNYLRNTPGWATVVVHDGHHGTPHTVRVTTPTGHHYTSRAPDPP